MDSDGQTQAQDLKPASYSDAVQQRTCPTSGHRALSQPGGAHWKVALSPTHPQKLSGLSLETPLQITNEMNNTTFGS